MSKTIRLTMLGGCQCVFADESKRPTEGTCDTCGEDFHESSMELPARNEVCGRCEGEGCHLHPAIGQHAYSAEEFRDSFDEEEQEEYFKVGGMYDVPCDECKGNKVVLVPNEDVLNAEQKAFLERWNKEQREIAQQNYEDAYTRRMESGGYGY